jgi:hypothetical protein
MSLLLDLRHGPSVSTLTWSRRLCHLEDDWVPESWDQSLILILSWHSVVDLCNSFRTWKLKCALVNLTILPQSLNDLTFLWLRTLLPLFFLGLRLCLLWRCYLGLSWSYVLPWRIIRDTIVLILTLRILWFINLPVHVEVALAQLPLSTLVHWLGWVWSQLLTWTTKAFGDRLLNKLLGLYWLLSLVRINVFRGRRSFGHGLGFLYGFITLEDGPHFLFLRILQSLLWCSFCLFRKFFGLRVFWVWSLFSHQKYFSFIKNFFNYRRNSVFIN